MAKSTDLDSCISKQLSTVFANVCILSFTGLALNYELGKTYKYNYATQLQISEGKDNTLAIVGLKIAAQAGVAVVWQNGDDKILQFTVS